MEGHRARRCPYPKKTKRDEEARGVLPPAQVSTTSALIEEDEETNSQLERLSQRLEKLENEFTHKREQLLNTVAAETEAGGHLGPSVLAEVSVNGVPTQALVDTGSPATVISLDFLLGILVKERSKQQTPAEWRKATLAKFSPPSVVMRAYSGHKLSVLAQMNVSLSYRSCTIEATVLVQDGAPRNLLLGTDVQPKLGFALVAQVDDKLTDLLTKKRVVAAQAVTTQDGSEAPPNHVRRDSQLEEDPPSVPRDATWSNDCLLVTDSDSEGTVATQPRTQCACSAGGRQMEQEGQEMEETQEDSAVVQSQRQNELGSSTATEFPVDGDLETCTNYTHICIPQQTASLQDQGPETRGSHQNQPSDNGGTPMDTADRRSEDLDDPHGVVYSLSSTKIPPRHWKIIRAEVRGVPGATLLLFTPSQSLHDLAMAEAAILGGDGIQVTLMVQNSSTVPVILEAGKELGTAAVVEPVEVSELSNKQSHAGVVSQLKPELEVRREELLRQLNLSLDHLTQVEQTQVEECMLRYADTFALTAAELGTTDVTSHRINTGDHPPIRQPPRRMPFALREEVEQMVADMLAQGVIVPSASPWASPVVLVRKRDGGVRFCVDYRRLNRVASADGSLLTRKDSLCDPLWTL